MKKNGFTIVEIIVSVGLISVVMLLLFQLLTDMEYEEAYSSFAKENQINRATIIRTVQNDLMSNSLSAVSLTAKANSKEIDFQFDSFSRTLIIFRDRITYSGTGETWMLESGNNEAYFDLDKISITNSQNTCTYILNIDTNGDGVCDYNCDTNNNGILDTSEYSTKSETYRRCPAYKSIRVIIPVINTDERENSIDDLEFFYIGK